MMGAVCCVCRRGHNVILRDVNETSLERGLAHCRQQVDKRLKHLNADEKSDVFNQIKGTLSVNDLVSATSSSKLFSKTLS